MPLKIGYGLLTAQRPARSQRGHEDLLADVIAEAILAEQVGFDSVWSAEHHFIDDGHVPSPLVLLAALAAATQRVELGTAVLLAPLYDHLRLVEDAALVALLSRNRLILGLGSGWRTEELDAFGVAAPQRFGRLRDAVSAFASFNADGEVDGFRPTPRPLRPIPIWLGGHGPRTLRLAGERANGYVGASGRTTSLDGLRRIRAQITAARQQAGRPMDGFTFALYVPVFACRDRGSWQHARAAHHYTQGKYDQMRQHHRMAAGDPAPSDTAAADASDDRAAATTDGLILGPPEQVVHRLLEIAQVLGPDAHLILRAHLPGLDPDLQREGIVTLGAEVLPALRAEVA